MDDMAGKKRQRQRGNLEEEHLTRPNKQNIAKLDLRSLTFQTSVYILERNGRGSKVVKVDQSRIRVRLLTNNLLQTPGVVVDEDATAYYAFLCPCCFSC